MKEKRREILKMVEEGLIGSEEAEKMLEAMEQAEQAKTAENEISQVVDWEQADKRKKITEKAKSKSSLLGYMGEAFQKIKKVDLDFNFGAFYTVSHIFQQETACTKLKLDVANGSLQLQPWLENDIRIECEATVYKVDSQEKAREKFLQEAVLRAEDKRLTFHLGSQQVKINIVMKIPVRQYEQIDCKLFNGTITAEQLEASRFSGKTTNGSLVLSRMTGEELDLETANGSVKVQDSKYEDLELETVNGTIHFAGGFAKTSAQAVNGSIHGSWKEGSRAHTAFLKTVTGSIRAGLPADLRIEGQAETKIGTIHCPLESYQIREEKKDKLNKRISFTANPDRERVLYFEAETKTGSIWLLSEIQD